MKKGLKIGVLAVKYSKKFTKIYDPHPSNKPFRGEKFNKHPGGLLDDLLHYVYCILNFKYNFITYVNFNGF